MVFLFCCLEITTQVMFSAADLETAQMLRQVYLAFATVSVTINGIIFAFDTIRRTANEISV